MEPPKFKYSPNAYELNLFKNEEGVCSVCNETRQLKYTSSFYSVDDPDYICPWCIADGSAAKKYDGEFNDYCGIEGVSPDPKDPEPTIPRELLLEITNKTPSYPSWQQEVWLSHCNEPCAFLGNIDSVGFVPLKDELQQDINELGIDPDDLTTDGSVVGYLFQCVNCGRHRLHVDFD